MISKIKSRFHIKKRLVTANFETMIRLSAADMRFTTKDDVLYALVFVWPDDGKVKIESLAASKGLRPQAIKKITMLSGGELDFLKTKRH